MSNSLLSLNRWDELSQLKQTDAIFWRGGTGRSTIPVFFPLKNGKDSTIFASDLIAFVSCCWRLGGSDLSFMNELDAAEFSLSCG